MKLDPTTPFSSIQGLNNRWSLNLANRNRIFLDLTKAADGRWLVNRITLPNHQGSLTKQPKKTTDPATSDEEKKAAAIVQSFLASIMQLDPASARQYIDPTKISYAKLAGLCILFEEGKYQFIEKKALRNMFLRNTSAGWIARIKTPDTDQPAMFAINTKRQDAQSAWKITEINLNQLLTDYVNRVSGGDIHYKPLIKNPKGGDALVIYFDLNSNQLTIRTQRQLIIVAKLLKTDAQRKLTISGYTDALGSDAYNLVLSEKRARQVMLFLSKNGVNPAQMNIASFGEAQPRVPNTSADGSDAPEGRRVNRRAEILLDF
ncbi:MAG: OmpA family protein [Verrucomicrobiae bacterium]|nr:OmpA family protein [Verrucomicrobiae bacterium]NNJ43504.1 OmpA family protein [Akkermansiaceae bacterium]